MITIVPGHLIKINATILLPWRNSVYSVGLVYLVHAIALIRQTWENIKSFLTIKYLAVEDSPHWSHIVLISL